MRIIGRIALFVVVVVLLLLVGSLFIPSTWQVKSATAIKAQPMDVFEVVSDLKTWEQWAINPAGNHSVSSRSYHGAESGEGAVMKWSEGKMEGVITMVNVSAPSAIEYDVSINGGKQTMKGYFEFMPDAEGTRVAWIFTGTDANPVSKYRMLIYKSKIENGFVAGLAKLKARWEKN